MAFYRATMFFRCSDQGWSETHYAIADTHQDVYDALLALANKRKACMPPDCFIIGLRVSATDTKRDSILNIFPAATGVGSLQGAYGGVAGPERVNQASDALICELRFDPATKNRIFLRGLPDSLIVSGVFAPDVGFTQALTGAGGFLSALLNSTIWRVRTKTPTGFSYSSATSFAQQALTSRKTGRPFGLRRGRRSKRRAV